MFNLKKMKEEILLTKSKKLSSSLSAPNFNKIKDYNNLKLNFNYYTLKFDNNYNQKKKYINNRNQDYSISYMNNTCKEKVSDYKEFLHKEGDDYEKLVIKNKNLKRLFEQVNGQLLKSLKKQQEMEEKYEKEKKMIIEKLSKIQNNYEIYACSHQQLKIFESKIDEISSTYNQLLELYLKVNEKFKEYKYNLFKLYESLNDFVENNYDKDLVNRLSFEFLLHLKNEIKDEFKINDYISKNQNILKKKNNNEILNNKISKNYFQRYYNSEFIKNKKNFKNVLFNIKSNNYLINKEKNELTSKNNVSKSKYVK